MQAAFSLFAHLRVLGAVDAVFPALELGLPLFDRLPLLIGLGGLVGHLVVLVPKLTTTIPEVIQFMRYAGAVDDMMTVKMTPVKMTTTTMIMMMMFLRNTITR